MAGRPQRGMASLVPRPTLTFVPLERHQRLIDRRAGERRQVRRRTHPRQSGFVEPLAARPTGGWNDVQDGVDVQHLIEEQGHPAHRYSVSQRCRV